MKLDKWIWLSIGILLLFFLVLFKLPGLRWVFGAGILFFLPYYVILDSFGLEKDEQAIFALFIGLGVTPSLIYYLNMAIPSFRVSLLIVSLVVYATAVIFWMHRRKARHSA